MIQIEIRVSFHLYFKLVIKTKYKLLNKQRNCQWKQGKTRQSLVQGCRSALSLKTVWNSIALFSIELSFSIQKFSYSIWTVKLFRSIQLLQNWMNWLSLTFSNGHRLNEGRKPYKNLDQECVRFSFNNRWNSIAVFCFQLNLFKKFWDQIWTIRFERSE